MPAKNPNFVLSDSLTVSNWSVRFDQPIANGKTMPICIGLDYELPTRSELKEIFGFDVLQAELKQDGIDVLDTADAMIDKIKARITGWHGVQDEDGNDLEFSQDGLEMLMGWGHIANAIVKSFIKACQGQKEKN